MNFENLQLYGLNKKFISEKKNSIFLFLVLADPILAAFLFLIFFFRERSQTCHVLLLLII